MEVSSLPRPRSGIALRPSRRLLAPLSDERLVEQVRRGNEAAFEVIYDRHHRGVLAFSRHMLRSPEEAEDAVQHTFISAYADLAASDKPIRLKAWLYTIARNRCLSMLRARREHPAELPEIPTAGLSDAVLAREDLRRLLADVQGLPEEQRAALVLSELGDLSHSEIAEIVGCDTVKVKALVFQARTSLLESRRASEIPCHEIREQLATLRGGALRRGPLRRHVRACPGCAEYRDAVSRQRKMLALALPVLPTAGLKHGVLAAAGVGPGAAGGAAGGTVSGGVAAGGSASSGAASMVGGVGAATTGGGVLSTIGAAGAAKIAVVAIVAAGGGVAVERATSAGDSKPVPGTSVHEGGTRAGGGAAAPGASAVPGLGATSPQARAAAAKAKARAAQHGAGHGKGAHGKAAGKAHGKGTGHGASSSSNGGRSSHGGSSSSHGGGNARHGGGHAQTGVGASHSGGGGGAGPGRPSQTGVGGHLHSPHGPPATRPPHPVTPSGSAGHGQSAQHSHGRHPAG